MNLKAPTPMHVAVVSIGRSGTSLIARILDQVLGVDFGDEADHIPRNHNNPDGYFENAAFLAFDERVLQAANAWVLNPPPLDYVAALPESQRAAFEQEAIALLAQYAQNKPHFGWKDPRLSFTLPFWRAASPNLIPVIAVRKPYSVLSSIGAQLERPVESMAGLWFTYYQHVFHHTQGLNRFFVNFDGLLSDPLPIVMALANHLGIHADLEEVQRKLAEIIKPQQSKHSFAAPVASAADTASQVLDARTTDLHAYLVQSTQDGGQPNANKLAELLR
ncbi:MAG: sulfotransferase [Burkholderiales bacterium]